MTKKANTDLLEMIHGLIAEDMLNRLKSGSCEAKDWAVIVKFLKDNGIDSLQADDADGASAMAALIRKAQESASQYQ